MEAEILLAAGAVVAITAVFVDVHERLSDALLWVAGALVLAGVVAAAWPWLDSGSGFLVDVGLLAVLITGLAVVGRRRIREIVDRVVDWLDD